MAFADLSFKFYTDSNLTTQFSNLYQLTHYTDLSDGNQDFTLYFGSVETDRKLEASSNPGVANIELTPTDILAAWEASTAYSLGDVVQPTTPNGYKYRCTVAGTSDSSEPTWPTNPIGTTVTDNTATWTLISEKHSVNEIKLASTSGGLTGASGGAALSLGTTIQSGAGNAVEVHLRVTNAVTTVNNSVSHEDIGLNLNALIESEDL